MEPDSLRFLTLINKVQSHSVGGLRVLGVFVFKTLQKKDKISNALIFSLRSAAK